ncbi:hypothetical protein ACIJDA_002848 [Enterococcus faecalis]|uniref:hypothetical protein n=2 Tax=Enterococcus faecalis TaxID=1351 RepID=UPI001925FEB8|nr:hypothetical protein [Enterococcus faecalis]HBC4483922.1 hypothetical protein [Enterococcus faecalis]HBC7262559.1 hypothetical protein [Enterococcus faecalis]
MSMSIQSGDKVKYIGKGVPQYTNQFLVVKTVLVNGLILEFPEKDKRKVALEGGGIWNMNSLVCGFNEVEESC